MKFSETILATLFFSGRYGVASPCHLVEWRYFIIGVIAKFYLS